MSKEKEQEQVKICKLDIRSFDPVYGTVTFDFKIDRVYDRGSGHSLEFHRIDGSAIITVSSCFCKEQLTKEELQSFTNIVWYQPDDPKENQYYRDSDDELKGTMRKIAYDTIWAVRNNGRYES